MPLDKPAKCKFCGDPGLLWRCNADSSWTLIDSETDTKHECPFAARYYANEERLKEQRKPVEREGYL